MTMPSARRMALSLEEDNIYLGSAIKVKVHPKEDKLTPDRYNEKCVKSCPEEELLCSIKIIRGVARIGRYSGRNFEKTEDEILLQIPLERTMQVCKHCSAESDRDYDYRFDRCAERRFYTDQ